MNTLYRGALGFIIVTLAVILGAGAASAALPHTTPVTATVTAKYTPTPTQTACHAYASYARKHTQPRLNRLITAAAALPNGYFRADLLQLGADAASPKGAQYTDDDLTYAGEDAAAICPAGTYGANAQ